MSAKRASGNRGIRRHRTPFEWALLVVSLAATVAVAAGLVVSGLAGPRGRVDLRVTVADKGGNGQRRPAPRGHRHERRRHQRRECDR